MTTIVAIETTSEFCCVALRHQNQDSYLYSDVKNSHADMLLGLINRLLSDASLTLNQVDVIGLVVGPGSFTGIRIGLSMAQGLAYGLDVPVVCINKLELLAQAALSINTQCAEQTMVVATDANMGDVFWQSFDVKYCVSGNLSNLEAITEPNATKISQAQSHLMDQYDGAIVAGDAFTKNKLTWQSDHIIDVTLDNICSCLLLLCEQKLEAQQTVSAFDIEPLYVRTEITWKKRERIRSA